MFKRIIDFHLDRWKTDPFRKPLLLRGARQDSRPLYAAVSLAHESQKEALRSLVI